MIVNKRFTDVIGFGTVLWGLKCVGLVRQGRADHERVWAALTDLLLESLVVECWRLRQALDIEMLCLNYRRIDQFTSIGSMSNLQRYRTASQRAFLKNLELLDELPPPTSEGDEDEAEGEAPTPQPENPPPALEQTSGLTVAATEQGSPPVGDP